MGRTGVVKRLMGCAGLLLGLSASLDAQSAHATSTLHVTAIAAGLDQTLALLSNGTVMAWGENSDGDLGIGNTAQSDLPVPVPGLSNVRAIAAAEGSASYALLANGTVMAWGANDFGQLGNGSTQSSDLPRQIPGLNNAVAIAAMDGAAFALLRNHTVMAWGINGDGQLGDGERSTNTCYCTPDPVRVRGLSAVKAVAGGTIGVHALALLTNGTMQSWGEDGNGELGNGEVTGSDCCLDAPVHVDDVKPAEAIAAGNWTSFALQKNGTVMGWGVNNAGQLGQSPGQGTPKPTAIPGLTGVKAISTGAFFVLALRSDGTVVGLGEDGFGELGNGTVAKNSCGCIDAPVQVSNLTSVQSIATGTDDSFAILENGTVMAWGTNQFGQLGDGNSTNTAAPVPIEVVP